MKTIASRTLAASPGQVWAALEREGALVVTEDGAPRCIMMPTSDATFIEDVQEIVFARARRAIREIPIRAAENGAADLTQADIEREIEAARPERSPAERSGSLDNIFGALKDTVTIAPGTNLTDPIDEDWNVGRRKSAP